MSEFISFFYLLNEVFGGTIGLSLIGLSALGVIISLRLQKAQPSTIFGVVLLPFLSPLLLLFIGTRFINRTGVSLGEAPIVATVIWSLVLFQVVQLGFLYTKMCSYRGLVAAFHLLFSLMMLCITLIAALLSGMSITGDNI